MHGHGLHMFRCISSAMLQQAACKLLDRVALWLMSSAPAMIVVIIPLQEFDLSVGLHGCIQLCGKGQANLAKLLSQSKTL